MQLADCEAMLVTQSEHGMTLVPRTGEVVHIPAHPVKVRDVSGAGDTVAAVLAVTLAAGADWETALRMANAAAAVAVGKKGTASVTSAELRRKILPHAFLAAEEKIVAAGGDLDGHLLEWRKQGLRIGFTNGCFDILHPGHVKVLTAARAACDRLIVGLNSDASVKRLKGEGRPVQDEQARSEVLAALEAVDLVAIFEEDTPLGLISADQAERAGEGRRLQARAGRRSRDRRSRWRRSAAGRYPARLQHDIAGRSRARRPGVSAVATRIGDRRSLWRRWRDPAAWSTSADIFAILIAASLPWSTSLVAIFAAAFLVSMAPFLDVRAFLQSLKRPICVLPIALFALALVGNAVVGRAMGGAPLCRWPDLEAPDAAGAALSFRALRARPAGDDCLSGLLRAADAMSLIVAFDPRLALKSGAEYGVPVKNYIDQSQEFALCAVVLAYPVITLWRANRTWLAALLIAISLCLVANMLFVVVSRTALVTMPIMLAVFALLHLKWRSMRRHRLRDGRRCAGLAWATSPQVALDRRNLREGLSALQGAEHPDLDRLAAGILAKIAAVHLRRRRSSVTAPDRYAGFSRRPPSTSSAPPPR